MLGSVDILLLLCNLLEPPELWVYRVDPASNDTKLDNDISCGKKVMLMNEQP